MDCYIYVQKPWMDSKSSSFCKETGFQCSVGLFIKYGKKKAIFLDGRYTTAAKRLLTDVENLPYSKTCVNKWIVDNIPNRVKIFYDWSKFTIDEINWLFGKLPNLHGKDFQFEDEKVAHLSRLCQLPYSLTGKNYEEKFNQIRQVFSCGDALFLGSSSSIAWLCNVRDVNLFPSLMPKIFAIIKESGECVLYSDEEIDYSAINFSVKNINSLSEDLLRCQRIVLDPCDIPSKYLPFCQKHHFMNDPCAELKIVKTDEEIANLRQIHTIDSIAMTNFLANLEAGKYELEETNLVKELIKEKQKSNLYLCESFSTISAGDERSAEIHYNTGEAKKVSIFYLIDAGSQYMGGTTDVTRTICLGEPTNEQKEMYTRVLMGHIDVFLSDPLITPLELDKIARKYLNEVGKNYEHGTGHGIGYMSDVHERFVGISKSSDLKKFQKGMVLSNEPGYYEPGKYGIRIENAMCVSEDKNGKLFFESLTKVLYCQKLICLDMLTNTQKEWLDRYHEECKDLNLI